MKYIRDISLQYRCIEGDLPSRMPGKATLKPNAVKSTDKAEEKVIHIIITSKKILQLKYGWNCMNIFTYTLIRVCIPRMTRLSPKKKAKQEQ